MTVATYQSGLTEQLFELITQHFDKTELKALFFKLGWFSLFEDSKNLHDNAMTLVTLFERRKLLGELLHAIQTLRPNVDTKGIVAADPPTKEDLFHLPHPTTALVGRQAELTVLDDSFAAADAAIVGLIAAGGVGKSAITHEWLQRLKNRAWEQAQRVFAWSFYSQGTHETQTSATRFLEEALRFFDFVGEFPKSDDEKARTLAQLLRTVRFVLVLDGMEPLQHGVDVMRGEIKDLGLRTLLRDVRAHGLQAQQLVVLSSRQPVVELVGCPHYVPIVLETLSVTDGVALLQRLGVQGLRDNLEQAVMAFGGHALALVLLGNLLAEFYVGDVNQYQQVDVFKDELLGSHAERVMRFYETRWSAGSEELVFLQILGLFDRPMTDAELTVLLSTEGGWLSQGVPRLAAFESLVDLPYYAMQQVLQRLRKLGLLLPSKPGSYDTHPLIRAYFGQRLQQDPLQTWQDAHRLLFKHFQKVPQQKYPDTLEELEPLYRAVHHGCLAGAYREALLVFRERILRGDEFYDTNKLGAFADSLAVITGFFSNDSWTHLPNMELVEADKAWLLGQTSYYLMSLGRLHEAIKPRLGHIQLCEQLQNWQKASSSGRYLAVIYTFLGQLSECLSASQYGLKCAIKAKHNHLKMINQTKIAAVLHMQGSLNASLAAFIQAEKFYQRDESKYVHFYLVWNTRYCWLLLEMVQSEKDIEIALNEARYSLELCQKYFHLPNLTPLDLAYNYLTLGQSQAKLDQLDASFESLHNAVRALRKSGYINNFPRFLIICAKIYRQYQNYEQAQTDLEEAEEIIETCGMRLHAIDAALLRGNLALDQQPNLETAQTSYQHAAQEIQAIGYHQRDVECELLAARLYHYQQQPDQAQQHLQRAHARMAEIGQWGLRDRWEIVQQEIS